MKVAIMQPYFFPYIGYWQLIEYSELFILFDDIQYIRHGWINRNRILKPGKGDEWQYINIPLLKHSHTSMIKDIYPNNNTNWVEKILGQLKHYKNISNHYNFTIDLVTQMLCDCENISIADINEKIIAGMCEKLGIRTEIKRSSEMNFDYSEVSNAGDWALVMSEQVGASEYINPSAGRELFNKNIFLAKDIQLSFMTSDEVTYNQNSNIFIPGLSIIDVLMFNGVDGTQELLTKYSIES